MPLERDAIQPRRRRNRTLRDFHFCNWLDAQIIQSGRSRRSIARHFGYKSESRIAAYLKGEHVPRAETVRKFAQAIGILTIEALREAGHHSAILDDFSVLYRRGWMWCQRDAVGFDASAGAIFFRATCQDDLRKVPPDLRGRYHQGTIYGKYLSGAPQVIVSAPLPIAIGILLAVGYFPRRGDVPKEGIKDLLTALALESAPILAESWVNPNPNRPNVRWHALADARELFNDRRRLGELKAALCAEYVHDWADAVCLPYARYARLALYSHGGLVSLTETIEGPGPLENDPWSFQYAEPPAPVEFRTSGRS